MLPKELCKKKNDKNTSYKSSIYINNDKPCFTDCSMNSFSYFNITKTEMHPEG